MTGKVRLESDLHRKKWLRDGLLESAHQSFWNRFTRATSDGIVYLAENTSCGTGHTIVFDYSGKLSGKQYKGDTYTYGMGEVKRKFSDKLVIEEYSLYVSNGSKFDACDIGDLSLPQHLDSRRMLADLYQRHKDQALFDTAQGATGLAPTHIIDLGTSVGYDDLYEIEDKAKQGDGFVTADDKGKVSTTAAKRRAPLEGAVMDTIGDVYVWVVDSYTARKIKQDNKYQTILMNADVRGNDNRLIKGVIGKLGRLLIVEAPVFFGRTEGAGTFEVGETEIQFSGLRAYGTDDAGNVFWEGQAGFDAVKEKIAEDVANGNTANQDAGWAIYSRSLLLGSGALQYGRGMEPNYELEWGPFKKTSESMLEHWSAYGKTKLTVESGADYEGHVADIDYGVIAVDLKRT